MLEMDHSTLESLELTVQYILSSCIGVYMVLSSMVPPFTRNLYAPVYMQNTWGAWIPWLGFYVHGVAVALCLVSGSLIFHRKVQRVLCNPPKDGWTLDLANRQRDRFVTAVFEKTLCLTQAYRICFTLDLSFLAVYQYFVYPFVAKTYMYGGRTVNMGTLLYMWAVNMLVASMYYKRYRATSNSQQFYWLRQCYYVAMFAYFFLDVLKNF